MGTVTRMTLAVATSAMALWPAAPADAAAPGDFPMHFSLRPDGILAEGKIDRYTPVRFVSFVRRVRAEQGGHLPRAVIFHSPGGNLFAAMRLGEMIRRMKLDTRLAADAADSGSECYSACTYAFLGGVHRVIETGGRIGVHHFSSPRDSQEVEGEGERVPGRGTLDPRAVSSYLADYVRRMGVDVGLVDAAAAVPPHQPTRLLTEAEAAAWRVVAHPPAHP